MSKITWSGSEANFPELSADKDDEEAIEFDFRFREEPGIGPFIGKYLFFSSS